MKFYLRTFSLFACIVSSAAIAGYIQPAEVDVDFVNGFAQGDQWTARTDADNDVFIGCGSRRISDGAGGIFYFGFCQAEDADGDNLTCFTQDEGLINAIEAVTPLAYITFSFVDDGTAGPGDPISYECTRVGHSTQSFYLPEFKTKN